MPVEPTTSVERTVTAVVVVTYLPSCKLLTLVHLSAVGFRIERNVAVVSVDPKDSLKQPIRAFGQVKQEMLHLLRVPPPPLAAGHVATGDDIAAPVRHHPRHVDHLADGGVVPVRPGVSDA